jgi:hypothetical protein
LQQATPQAASASPALTHHHGGITPGLWDIVFGQRAPSSTGGAGSSQQQQQDLCVPDTPHVALPPIRLRPLGEGAGVGGSPSGGGSGAAGSSRSCSSSSGGGDAADALPGSADALLVRQLALRVLRDLEAGGTRLGHGGGNALDRFGGNHPGGTGAGAGAGAGAGMPTGWQRLLHPGEQMRHGSEHGVGMGRCQRRQAPDREQGGAAARSRPIAEAGGSQHRAAGGEGSMLLHSSLLVRGASASGQQEPPGAAGGAARRVAGGLPAGPGPFSAASAAHGGWRWQALPRSAPP